MSVLVVLFLVLPPPSSKSPPYPFRRIKLLEEERGEAVCEQLSGCSIELEADPRENNGNHTVNGLKPNTKYLIR